MFRLASHALKRLGPAPVFALSALLAAGRWQPSESTRGPKLPATLEDAQAKLKGQMSMTGFLTPPLRKPGRPTGSGHTETRGRPTTAAASATPPAPSTSGVTDGRSDGRENGNAGKKRFNYSMGEPAVRLAQAVHDWDNKTGTFLEEEDMRLERFPQLVEIPYQTFKTYVCKDATKRKVLGTGVGGDTPIDDKITAFLVSVMRRRDRANDGMDRQEGIDVLQTMLPTLTRKRSLRMLSIVECGASTRIS